jgi:hypothetical protein
MLLSDTNADWLVFLAILLGLTLLVFGVVIWLKVFRQSGLKTRGKHHKHRHHRHANPTLAEAGGLPPVRPPDQPPRGV